jgi:hypothetical protein
MNSKHLSKTAEQYTPLWLVEKGREVLGGTIDLDPASTAEVNYDGVCARKFFTKRDDGLKQDWGTSRRPSTVFVNPPGGQFSPRQAKQIGTRSKQVAFWVKLMDEVHAGHVHRAMFLSFSVELLQSCQRALPSEPGWYPLDFSWCIPAQRIKFEKIKRGQRIVGKQPSHANILIFPGCNLSEVRRVFGDVGRCGRGG